ncbi:hypothetical protein UA08_04774 [Talaromyces atroroseus]|uniref:Stress-response A/B barrel domain-containing protein n=1 Tax=Talaromyces atroroseus TaxID=1441469 RepID=A0A225AGL9_TALAT|nr:hypothetical protein UA08_04774 [Talaromyces atroroseus]OKL59840.1 hypothetical protein UA08_04774 [Talaromyces atroroseus]
MAPIERITLFNIPKEEDRLRLVEEYKQLSKTAVKDGKPYISNVSFGPGFEDPRSQGYNFGVKTTFATIDDMRYYDTTCEAHKTLKAYVGGVRAGDVLTVYYENAA